MPEPLDYERPPKPKPPLLTKRQKLVVGSALFVGGVAAYFVLTYWLD